MLFLPPRSVPIAIEEWADFWGSGKAVGPVLARSLTRGEIEVACLYTWPHRVMFSHFGRPQRQQQQQQQQLRLSQAGR